MANIDRLVRAENELKNVTEGPTRSNTYWTSVPPTGNNTASSYYYYFNTESSANVALTNSIANIVVSLFVSIMTVPLGDVVGTLASFLVTLYTMYVNNDPTTNAVSYRAYVYTLTSGTGYVNSSYGYCYKYSFNFYSRTNYTGTLSGTIQYKQII